MKNPILIITCGLFVIVSMFYFSSAYLKRILASMDVFDSRESQDYAKIRDLIWINSVRKGEGIPSADSDRVFISDRLFYDMLCVMIRDNLGIKPLDYDKLVLVEVQDVKGKIETE
jgi:hypothetical protein